MQPPINDTQRYKSLFVSTLPRYIKEATFFLTSGAIKRLVFLSFLALIFTLFSASTSNATTKTSTGNGNWSASGTWNPSGAPTNGDDVIIAAGHTVTIDVATNNLASLTINGTLSTGAGSITVSGNVTINSGGSIVASDNNSRTMSIGGNLKNDGTLDCIGNGNRRINITFNGNANQTVSGTGGTTNFNLITINNTGAANDNIVEVTSTNFTVPSSFLTLTDGIFKVSGSFTLSNNFFTPAAYTIASGAGIWLNNSNVTVTGQNGTPTLDGSLRVTAGTYNVGANTGNTLQYNSGASFTMEGGAVTIAGRFIGQTATTDTIVFNMSGGTLTVCNVGSASNSSGSFDIGNSGSSFTMSGGTIVLQNESTAVTPLDYRNVAGTVNISGGTVQFATATTAGSPTFVVGVSPTTNVFPSLSLVKPVGTGTATLSTPITILGNVTIASSTTLNANGQAISGTGNWTNNGTFTPGTSNVTFNGSSAQTIGGSGPTTFGSIPGGTPTGGLTINNSNGVTLGVGAIVSGILALTNGDLNTSTFILTMGAGATSSGTFDVVGNVNRGDVTAGTTRSFGNPNVQITQGAGTSGADITVNLAKTTPAGFANAITRTYDITKNGGTLVPVGTTVRLRYQDSELNGNSEASLQIWRKDGATWNALGGTVDTTNNHVTYNFGVLDHFSLWTIAGPSAPTDVALVSFNATSYDSGTFVEWKTGYEVDNLGFNVYREVDGKRSLINSSLVAGSALVAGSRTVLRSGESYGWWDPSPPSKHFVQYYLEDIDLNGKRTIHGPIAAKPIGGKPPTTGRAALLSQRGAAAASVSIGLPASIIQRQSNLKTGANNLAVQWDLASRQAVKISINKEGWYRIFQPQLVAAGLDPSRDPRFLQLFADGQELPIIVNGGTSGRLDPTDSIEFYATALDTPYTDSRVYWLASGSQQGRRIEKVSGQGKPSQTTGFQSTIERKDRTIYFAALTNGEADNFFGPIITTEPVSQTIPVRHLDSASNAGVTLEVALQGVTDIAGGAPDHTVSVKVNGTDIGSISFDGREHKVSSFTFSGKMLQEGDNTITFAAASEMDVTLIDYAKLTYPHTFKAENNALRFNAIGQEALRITGFDNDQIRVFDITDLNNVQEIAAATETDGAGFAVIFTAPGARDRVLFAISNTQTSSPAQITANQPSSWNRAGQGADALVITHKDFTGAVTPLVTFRRGQGYAVSVVDVEDLYDEFNFGARSPQAVRDFLARANSAWKKRPRFALLVGDASFDPRNYLGLGFWDLVPTKLVTTSMLETASDDWLADFNSDGVPEIAVGRLPARSSNDASAMAAKIIDYERGPRAEGVVMVADRIDDYNFETESRNVSATLPPGIAIKEIFRGPMGDQTARAELLAAISRGPKIVNYLGHGSVGIWRGNLLTVEDAEELSNSQAPTMYVAMTCLNGFFQDQYGESLAEVLIKTERGGAIAAWASSSLTEAGNQSLMNQELYRQIFNNRATIGEAAMRAKAFVGNIDIRQSWILFGDPMTKLK